MSNLLSVYPIQIDVNSGTCFEISDSLNRSWLVTAKHNIHLNALKNDTIVFTLKIDGVEQRMRGLVYGIANPDMDVALIYIGQKIATTPFTVEQIDVPISKDIYLMGYPRDLLMNEIQTSSHGFKLPIVLKGILSGVVKVGFEEILYINGSNISGMSGGPALYYDPIAKTAKLIGVIIGYSTTESPVYQNIEQFQNKTPVAFTIINNGLAIVHSFNFRALIKSYYAVQFKGKLPPMKLY